MRSLVALLGTLGLISGAAVGAIAHHNVPPTGGWTLYEPRRYADYLPATRPSWFPGIVEYTAVGLGVGLVVGAVLAAMGLRLVRARRLA